MPDQIVLPDGIEKLDITDWENGHQNFTHRFKKGASFKLRIPTQPVTPSAQYRKTTSNFQWLIRYAIEHDISLRAMGNGWSFTDVAVCDGGVVDTKALRLSFWIPQQYVASEYVQAGNGSANLFLVQCGMSILDLNEKLEQFANPKRSLKTSGASNGQSIVGATATGTHGSAYRVGAVHDAIVGMHLVVSPTKHIWLERASAPVVSDKFGDWMEAEIIRDDDLFNAAVVSFGSFGFVHSVMIETEPIFLLAEQRADSVKYDDDLIHTINSLDFSGIETKLPYPVDGPDKQLYHFEVIINPHQFGKDNKEKGVYLKTMYKMPYTPDYPKRVRDDHGFQYGDNTLGVIETIIDGLPDDLSAVLVPKLVNVMFPLAFKSTGDAFGTIGETFSNTKFRGKAISAAIAVAAENVSRVVEEVILINRQSPFPGGLALRYVKGTKAVLGFTRYEKTCILELDGVDSDIARRFYQQLWDRLESQNIPYTLHWGKMNFNLDPQRVRRMYGNAAVDTWINCRHSLLGDAERKVFNNAFLQRCGLDI